MSNNDWNPTEQNEGQPVKTDYISTPFYVFNTPKQSKWRCYMFGNRPGGAGIAYNPQEGKVPNAFVRWMMRICFDCIWVKNDD